MQTFEEAMLEGQAEYQDVIDALGSAGYRATFTQTGGMNAALEVLLDGGWALLITDANEALSWARSEQQGWGVGLFTPEERYWAAPTAFASTPAVDVASLLALVQQVLRDGIAQPDRPEVR